MPYSTGGRTSISIGGLKSTHGGLDPMRKVCERSLTVMSLCKETFGPAFCKPQNVM